MSDKTEKWAPFGRFAPNVKAARRDVPVRVAAVFMRGPSGPAEILQSPRYATVTDHMLDGKGGNRSARRGRSKLPAVAKTGLRPGEHSDGDRKVIADRRIAARRSQPGVAMLDEFFGAA